MKKFNGTIEYLLDQKAAVIELTNVDDEKDWAMGRIELPRAWPNIKQALYEEGYRMLAMSAHWKGGRLETYKEFQK